MSGLAKASEYRRTTSDRHIDRAGRTALAIAGALFSLVGLVLAVGGYLSPINGSPFQMLAGIGLIVSGALIARRHRAGAWIYILVFAGTVSWSLSNIESGSSLAGRLIGPTLLLIMMAVLMPLLCGWRTGQTLTVFILLIAGTIVFGISSLPNGPLGHQTAAVTQFLDAETKGILQ